jgi:hypothetical protein
MSTELTTTQTGRIYKSTVETKFTTIPNKMLRRKDLSLKAKGLLCMLLSLPEDWKIYKSQLSDYTDDGKDSINTAFAELEEKGYIEKFAAKQNGGRFAGYNYMVTSEPVMDGEQTQETDRDKQRSKTRVKIAEERAELHILNEPSLTEEQNKTWQAYLFWVAENAPNVSNMREPLTAVQLVRLMDKYGKDMVKDVLQAMHNTAGLLKKYVSANLTCDQWCKRRIGGNGKTETKMPQQKSPTRSLRNLPNSNLQSWYRNDSTHPLWAIANNFGDIDYSQSGKLQGAIRVEEWEDVSEIAMKMDDWHKEFYFNLSLCDFAVFSDNTIQPLGEKQKKQMEMQGRGFLPSSIKKGLIQ